MPKNLSEFSNSIILATILILILCGFIVLNLILYYFKRRKHLIQQNILRTQFSQALLQTKFEIQEQTLQHISHELHDNLGQVASLIKINLNTLQLSDHVKAAEKIEDTKELTRQLITDLKSLSVSLGADRIVQVGLANSLEIEVARLNKTGQFTASFTLEGQMPDLNKDEAVILYRMAQEVLNNIVKHSAARQIKVILRVTENLFILAFNDDGVGFDIEKKKNSGGAGFINLQNRARLINSQLIIQSTPGTGTQVTIEMPI